MVEDFQAAGDQLSLADLGYAQELDRRMSGFSNFALSFSIICILAGGITSFHLGFSAAGGGAIGLGWPLACLFSLIVALAMGQLASAFPTAGGLYHWAAILGGRGWGWATAWFNLAGLITVLAAINVGTVQFVLGAFGALFGERFGLSWDKLSPSDQLLWQEALVAGITLSQGLCNHRGIKLTTLLTDFSGYLILAVSAALTLSLLLLTPHFEFSRLITFTNYSGARGGDVWPASGNLVYLFALALLLPAYTITGFDASAHTAEETLSARTEVPRGMVRAVLISAVAGWLMISAIVLAMPSLDEAAAKGPNMVVWVMSSVLPSWLGSLLLVGISLAQYLCGLATVTSASRMMFAFARDGGLPWSTRLRKVHPRFLTPSNAVWASVVLAILFTVYTPVYSTITVVCVILLYLSYVLPVFLGLIAYGRTWTRFGPWQLGALYRPLAAVAVLGCGFLLWVGVQPPNQQALVILAAMVAVMLVLWFGLERRRFRGPPTVPAIK